MNIDELEYNLLKMVHEHQQIHSNHFSNDYRLELIKLIKNTLIREIETRINEIPIYHPSANDFNNNLTTPVIKLIKVIKVLDVFREEKESQGT